MIRSLRSRLMAGAALLAVLFMLALFPVLQSAFNQTLEQVIVQRLAADANSLISAAQIEDGQLLMPDKLPDEEFNLPEAKLLGFIFDIDGNLIWQSRSAIGQQIDYIPRYDGGVTDFLRISNRDGREYYVYDVELHLNDNYELPFSFITMLPTSEFRSLFRDFQKQLYRWLGASLLVLLLLLWLGLTWALRSLKNLRAELDQIESGGRERLSDRHPHEVLRLTRSLNRLLDSERRQRERYRDTLGDLAHSLKTPLAVLQGVSETLSNQPQQREQAKVLSGQIERMSQQIGYQLQRASLRKSGLIQHRVILAPLLELLSGTLNKVYHGKRVVLHQQFSERFWVPMEKGALMELLGNLLENSYRLCLHQIRVSARYTDTACELRIEDDGPGVPEHQRERILRRGERLDTQHPGQGIGLSVVKDIIESYDGELSLGDSELGGAAFLIRLPIEGALFAEFGGAPWYQLGRPSRRQTRPR
ncbi:histidine kinase [Pseudomonas sp. WN033]|nr:histidine kinase [Pseudomonas sp. WN033]